MAKATEKDMDAALAMCRALESLEDGYLPDEMTPGEEMVAYYADEHAEKVVEYLVGIQKRASLFRVCFGMTVVLDPANEIVDPELSHLELHPRLLACKSACAGIPDEKLQSWLNPPEGQLGAPHGTWSQQLAAAGQQQVELLSMLDTLCNGLAWNIENHPEVMNESDAEALQAARALLEKFGVQP